MDGTGGVGDAPQAAGRRLRAAGKGRGPGPAADAVGPNMSSPPEHLQAKRVELILQQLEQLPTLPAVAMRVAEAAADSQSSIDELVSLISSDVSLTTRILQLVHRADLGVRGEVNSLERAVVLLGFDAVRSAVLAITVFQTFAGPSGGESSFSREDFWKHCLAVACCAELLAEALHDPAVNSSEAFVCGLLHDLGKVALDTMLPKSFARVVEAADLLRGNIADVERSIIGLDHMVVGKRLAERWNLPKVICECLWLHNQLPRAQPATVQHARMINLITLADLLVREQHLGYSGNYTFPITRADLCEAIGLPIGSVDAAIAKLLERTEARAQALRLGQSSSQELYQQAMARVNQELGRVSGQLAAKNRRLAIRRNFRCAQLVPERAAARFSAAGGAGGDRPDRGGRAGRQLRRGILADAGAELRGADALRRGRPGVRDLAGRLREASGGRAKPVMGRSCTPAMNWIGCCRRSPHAWRGISDSGSAWKRMVFASVGWCGARYSGEAQRLAPQVQELSAISGGWGLALRTAQIREEARAAGRAIGRDKSSVDQRPERDRTSAHDDQRR